MPKVPLLSLPRVVRPSETRTFTDPDQPGVEVTLTLRRLNALEGSLAAERATELVSLYGETGYPVLNGEAAPISPDIATTLTALEAMQAPDSESDRYNAEELIGLAVNMPTAWLAVTEWAGQIERPIRSASAVEDDASGNITGAA